MKTALVLTSIRPPTKAVHRLHDGMPEDWEMFMARDVTTPDDWSLPRATVVPIECPELFGTRQYSRKNVGYLAAIRNNPEWIVETDDDNSPYPNFFSDQKLEQRCTIVSSRTNWVNTYSFFTHQNVWPRGFPLERVLDNACANYNMSTGWFSCPVQQGLPDGDPDVDAVYRLTQYEPVMFNKHVAPLCLAQFNWCPWNSQNTRWHKSRFMLMYLPVHCPNRLSDLIRSFVVHRILWGIDQYVAYHAPTVYQDRNPHDLFKDFRDEVQGYLNYSNIADVLTLDVSLLSLSIDDCLRKCYAEMIDMGMCRAAEMNSLEGWIKEVHDAGY